MLSLRKANITSSLASIVVGIISHLVIKNLVESVALVNMVSGRSKREWFVWHYRGLRRMGIFPLCAVWVAWRRENPTLSAAASIVSLLPVIVARCVVITAVRCFREPKPSVPEAVLWIESPSGGTVRSLPFYTALRVVRKHNWSLVPVAPVRVITRWEALKIIIRGDKG